MVRITLYAPILVAILGACGSDAAHLDGPVDGAAAEQHVRELIACNPRHSGTPGAKKAAEYLKGQLDKMGVAAEIQEFLADPRVKTEDGGRMTLRNVIGRIPGSNPEGPILIFGTHYDTKRTTGHDDESRNFEFEGAIDGGGANGTLLELARHLKDRDNKLHVWFTFFDGEESVPWVWDTDQSLMGSRHFVRTLDKATRSRIKAFINLDLIGDKNFKIDRDLESSKQLQNVFAEVAKDHGVQDVVYRYESTTTDDHTSFKRFGVPAALLIDFKYRIPPPTGEPAPEGTDYAQWWHTADDNMKQLSPDTLAFAGNLMWLSMEPLEEHILNPRGK